MNNINNEAFFWLIIGNQCWSVSQESSAVLFSLYLCLIIHTDMLCLVTLIWLRNEKKKKDKKNENQTRVTAMAFGVGIFLYIHIWKKNNIILPLYVNVCQSGAEAAAVIQCPYYTRCLSTRLLPISLTLKIFVPKTMWEYSIYYRYCSKSSGDVRVCSAFSFSS